MVNYNEAYLTLNNIDFEDLHEENSFFNYDHVKRLRIDNNALKIKESAFLNFQYLRSIDIYASTLATVHFQGFDLGSNNYFQEKHKKLRTLQITKNLIKELNTNIRF